MMVMAMAMLSKSLDMDMRPKLGSQDVKFQVLCPGSWEAQVLGGGDLQGGEGVEEGPEVGGESRCCRV